MSLNAIVNHKTKENTQIKTDSEPIRTKASGNAVKIDFKIKTDSVGDSIEKNKTNKIPPELDKQLDIVYKNGIADLDNMPKWLKKLGGEKVKGEFINVVRSEKFQKEMIQIMTETKAKGKNSNKDVTELLKEPGVVDKVFENLKHNTKTFSKLHILISIPIVKENFKANIKNNQHKYLLYGESNGS